MVLVVSSSSSRKAPLDRDLDRCRRGPWLVEVEDGNRDRDAEADEDVVGLGDDLDLF